MPSQDITVYAEFVSTTSTTPNMGMVGRSVNQALNGLRFIYRMNKKTDNTIIVNGSNYTIKEYGTLITSQQVLTAKGATRSELSLDVYTNTAAKLYSANNKIVNVNVAATGIKYDECSKYVDFSVCITGLSSEAMKNATIVSRPYVVYSNGTDDVTFYLDAVASSYNAYTTVIAE